MTCATLFAGIGGLTLGAKEAGFAPLWAIEQMPDVARVYRYNIGDVTTWPVEMVDPAKQKRVDLLLASPPCAPFHSMRKIGGDTGKHRDADAGYAIILYLLRLLPRFFLLENISMFRWSLPFRSICLTLRHLKYRWEWKVLDAADYGVAMHRKRLFLVATRCGEAECRPRSVGEFLYQWPTPTEHVGWYSVIKDLPMLSAIMPEWMDALNTKQGVIIDSKRNMGKRGPYLTERSWNKPAFSLTSAHSQRPGYIVTYGNGAIKVTARMWARMMSFPDSFVLPQSEPQAVAGLGDAVPPRLAEQLCAGFKKASHHKG